MFSVTLIWYIAAGFLIGWITSTLVEWFWFRRSRGLGATGQGGADLPRPFPTRERRPLDEPDPEAEVGAGYRPFQVPAAASTAAAHNENRPDDLSEIRGIGEVYRERLYRAGIMTWHQLAGSDPESLRQATRALPGSDAESWITQAAELARQRGRIGATYSGPIPDALTRIEGIDQVFEAELYRHGIFTYDSLAATTPERLGQIISVEAVGDSSHFDDWIRGARDLRDAR